MTVQAVEAHIDSCTGVPPPPKSLDPATSKRNPTTSLPAITSKPILKPKPLPHPHYASIKDIQLRKKLSEQGLYTGGSRPQMEKRWSEFVIANNANCDAKSPKTRSELRRQMEVWERTQGGIDREGAQIKDKNFDGLAWGAKHGNVFNDLAALARSKIPKKTLEQSEAQPEAQLESHLGYIPNASSVIGVDDSTGVSVSGTRPYSSPYSGGKAHITIDYLTDPELPPLSAPSQNYQNDVPLHQNISTHSPSQSRALKEPSLSQSSEAYSIPAPSQIPPTPTRLTEHNTPCG